MTKEMLLKKMETLFGEALDMVHSKGSVYEDESGDRLAHIKLGALTTGLSPESYVHALVTKHFTALPIMFKKKDNFSMEKFLEYFIDIIVYTCYMQALIDEERDGRIGSEAPNTIPIPVKKPTIKSIKK